MKDLSDFDPNAYGNPNFNIFGLPFSEEEAQLIIIPVPWEVTVSGAPGTARAADQIYKLSKQIEIYDANYPESWKKGIYMLPPDKKIQFKSDFLRKEAELYVDYISQGNAIEKNNFMCKSLKDINEGSVLLNNWVYSQCLARLHQGKQVALLGGDHSIALGYLKALAEIHGAFGILQIDAHADLRQSYEHFKYSHANVMYNALHEIPDIKRLVQVGVRDYCEAEWRYVCNSNFRVITYLDQDMNARRYEGQFWKQIATEIIEKLPQKVYLSFDIDGLKPEFCPATGTPVAGGLDTEEALYLCKLILDSGRTLIGFDLSEIGVSENGWDANVGSRLLFRLSNMLLASNSK